VSAAADALRASGRHRREEKRKKISLCLEAKENSPLLFAAHMRVARSGISRLIFFFDMARHSWRVGGTRAALIAACARASAALFAFAMAHALSRAARMAAAGCSRVGSNKQCAAAIKRRITRSRYGSISVRLLWPGVQEGEGGRIDRPRLRSGGLLSRAADIARPAWRGATIARQA